MPGEILEYLPHRRPFRFVDEILAIDTERVVARYTFREDEFFYAGHFPDFKVTPGAILLEAMCQMGAATLGIYLLSLDIPRREIEGYDTVLTESELEINRPVFPGTTVTCRAEKLLWRHKKLRARAELRLPGGDLAACAVIGGVSLPKGRV